MYKTLIQPVIDYMSANYHSMLTLDQRKELIKLQRNVLKSIYGYKISYAEVLEMSGLQTLEERRQDCFNQFAIKLANNEKYSSWLPKTKFTGYNLREELIYDEYFAATDRLRNSPLYAISRRLNDIYLYKK